MRARMCQLVNNKGREIYFFMNGSAPVPILHIAHYTLKSGKAH